MNVKVLAHTENPEDLIARAARQCYSPDSAADITLTPEAMKKLVQKIIRNGHHSCLEHASITYAISGISRSCSHQLVRHRMASFSQQSQRYVMETEDDCENVIPKSVSCNSEVLDIYNKTIENAYKCYRFLINSGVPKEDARYVLPNATATDIVVTMNFRELLHFFGLRCCSRAQWEIRGLANKMLDLAKEISPVVFESAGAACLTCVDGCDAVNV